MRQITRDYEVELDFYTEIGWYCYRCRYTQTAWFEGKGLKLSSRGAMGGFASLVVFKHCTTSSFLYHLCFSFSHLSTGHWDDSWLELQMNQFPVCLTKGKMQWVVSYKTSFTAICVLAIQLTTWETLESKLCFHLGLREINFHKYNETCFNSHPFSLVKAVTWTILFRNRNLEVYYFVFYGNSLYFF